MSSDAGVGPKDQAPLILSAWDRGIAVSSKLRPSMSMFLWFWEWNMFGAGEEGQHTHGQFENARRVSRDGTSAVITTMHGMRLSMDVGAHGVDLNLSVTNNSNRRWDDLASIIPCFNPGPEEVRTEQFRNRKTWFVGPRGLDRLIAREIHFNDNLRVQVDGAMNEDGLYPWSDKWPTGTINAMSGLMVRESVDAGWVTGIAWERFLSAQGHNPWECLHLAVQVGPLIPKETREVRGRIYLAEGTREDLLAIHRKSWVAV